MKIERTEPVEGAKRQYIPFKLTTECPACGAQVVYPFDERNYLSYPALGGGPFTQGLACAECWHNWTCRLELVLELREVEE
jgi:hypothetical protein